MLALYAYYQRHRGQVLLGVSLLLAATLGWLIHSSVRENRFQEAAQALNAALAEPEPRAALENVAARWPRTDTAAQAMLALAQREYERNDYTAAATAYRRLLSEMPQHFFAASAQLGVAASLEAAGDLRAALAAYEELLTRYPLSHHEPEARMGMGRCHELLGNWEEARKRYEEVLHASPHWYSAAHERLIMVNRQLRAAKTASAPTAAPAENDPSPAPAAESPLAPTEAR